MKVGVRLTKNQTNPVNGYFEGETIFEFRADSLAEALLAVDTIHGLNPIPEDDVVDAAKEALAHAKGERDDLKVTVVQRAPQAPEIIVVEESASAPKKRGRKAKAPELKQEELFGAKAPVSPVPTTDEILAVRAKEVAPAPAVATEVPAAIFTKQDVIDAILRVANEKGFEVARDLVHEFPDEDGKPATRASLIAERAYPAVMRRIARG